MKILHLKIHIYYQYLQTQNGFTDYTWYVDNVLHSGPSNWGYNYRNNSTVGTYDITVSFEDNNVLTKSIQFFGKNKLLNKSFEKIANNGLQI